MYNELYRYEWYEGWRRSGFWGNIEDAIKKIGLGEAPKIAILSAGVGRDIAKVCLAAGIWKSSAPRWVRGTSKEISDFRMYASLVKPRARIMVTEFNDHSLKTLQGAVDQMISSGLLNEEMITVRKWDFRVMAPLGDNSQDLVIFSLTGNYAKIDEQSLILKEIARYVARGGHLIASTMRPDFDFSKAAMALKKIKIILSSPLAWPIAKEFFSWQIRWSQLAGRMNELKFWQNVPASAWSGFVSAAGMKETKIYSAPSKLVPVEVLVARKE
jgi:SAM-dependent methyltransferase